MNMDETSAHDTQTITPELQTKAPNAPSQSKASLSWIQIIIITLCAAGVASMLSITYLRLQPQQKLAAQPTAATQSKTLPWETIQRQIQELSQTQQELVQNNQQNQLDIKHLLQVQPALSQDWELQRARYYLELAQINAQISNNIPSVIRVLQAADEILAQSHHANLSSIRQGIAEDLKKLTAIPISDPNLILNKIKSLDLEIDELKAIHLANYLAKSSASTVKPQTWQEHLYLNLQKLNGLISIQHHDEDWLPFGPNYIAVMRENIRMNLQQAQLGLIGHDQNLYTTALLAATANIKAMFDPNNSQTQTILRALQSLQTSPVAATIPRLQPYDQLFAATLPEQTPEESPSLAGEAP